MHVSRADPCPVNGTAAIPRRRSMRNMSLLEHLRGCQRGWCPVAPWDRAKAHSALCGTPAGSFMVVRDGLTSLPSLLCVSAEGEDEAVLDYDVTCTGTVFQLSESCLSFSELAHLVFFYSLSRDVLAVCLKFPRWIYNVTGIAKDRLSQLQPKTWLSTPPDQMTDADVNELEPNTMMCSIQLTSANGALCVINPLYLLEHGDDWLTHQATSVQCPTQTPTYRRERRLSSTRKWVGAGLRSSRAVSLDQEAFVGTEVSGRIRRKSEESEPTSSVSSPQGGVVLRRSSQGSTSTLSNKGSTGSLSASSTELQNRDSAGSQSPHRVSWIEDGFWLPPPTRPSSLLPPPYSELDSLSISSIEEEQEHQSPSPTSHHPSAHRLADKVINRLSAVGQALGSLVCQKKRLTNRVVELSDRKRGPFAMAVKEFVEATLERGTDITGSEFLQEVRSSLTSLRETLLDYPDIQALLDSMTDLSDSEIDPLVELSVHKVALKPVSAHLYSCIHIWRSNDGSLQRLEHNQRVLEDNGVEALGGASGVGVPDLVTLERIQQRWASMHKAYSPNKKVHILLKVCKSIYHSMSSNSNSDVVLGADDFLPCLTWVLLRSDLLNLQIDTDYMMELLDPAQLQGEGGYYLTTLYAALYYISSFRPRLAARQLSVEAQHSLSQWHRRRTVHSNQSRHSKRRRTVRRQTSPEKAVQAEDGDTGEVGESVMGDPQQQTEMNTDETLDSNDNWTQD
ncbi:ras and Rab interactor 2-like isoform X1 [Entelurus aequoreus]|uniref:ras and Rab interactor 2-like isoform X1 n=2 Tax=Entelurus aequoreus TaxID=161455 RepID=UPI002B1D4678|nr:ras and Rab interactor 2-like isoform X1 [Entelurus aequoreus]